MGRMLRILLRSLHCGYIHSGFWRVSHNLRGGAFAAALCLILLLTACGDAAGRQNPSGEGGSQSVSASGNSSQTDPPSGEQGNGQGQEDSDPFSVQQTENGTSADEGISFMNLCGESSLDGYVRGLVIDFSKENPQYQVSYENASAPKDTVLMQVMNGAGPDLVCLKREDLENLQKNGSLGDLYTVLDPEILDSFFPAAVQMGTYDGKLYGLPTSVSLDCMVVNGAYWQQSSWTCEDVLGIMEEHPELKGPFIYVMGEDRYYYNLLMLFGQDVMNSPLVADGKSAFNTPFGKELFTLVKERSAEVNAAVPNGSGTNGIAEAILAGEYLGAYMSFYHFNTFGNIYNAFGEYFQPAAFPGQTEGKGYMRCSQYGMVAVNQASLEKPGVRELLNDFYSLESQQRVTYNNGGISIRRDVPESVIEYNAQADLYLWKGAGGNNLLLPKPENGEFYLDAFLDLAENTVPYPLHTDEMFDDIIMEEAQYYYESGKDLETVLETIDRRLQLYLSERGE